MTSMAPLTTAFIPSEDEVEDTTRRLGLLSNPNRLRLLAAIQSAPNSTVGQLADDLNLHPDKISYLVRALRDEKIVARRRTGRSAHYYICDGAVSSMMETLLGQWSEDGEDTSLAPITESMAS